MGYRSEVVLKLNKPASSALDAFASMSEDIKTLLSDADWAAQDDENGHVYFWSWIKWYDSYKGIGLIDEFLNVLPCESYGFIRLGEETDDIEHRGSPYDFNMHVNRSIEY
jgi:hypothetical protein